MATFSKEILQHFTHCSHPLTVVSANAEFLCKGCRTPGSGARYRCELCNLDLHQYCVDCPMELSSFMHQHSVKLVGCKPDHECDLCEDPVEGLSYRCELCDFSVHPICTQLPEYTRHVRHKAHPLRLEISVPIGCIVCKDMCSSWRYRCEDCSFHLHLQCTLAPCEEETTMSKAKTRSLGTPAPPQPSAWAPAFGGYGYGSIPPLPQYFAQPSFPPPLPQYFAQPSFPPPLPQYFAQPSFSPHVHGYGGISPPPQYFAQPSFPPHVHGYGGIVIPPPQYFAQPAFHPHVHGYGGIPPPQHFAQPSFSSDAHADHAQSKPSSPSDAHDHGAPSTDHAQSSGSEVEEHGGKGRKRMYAIVWSLALNVVGSLIAESLF
ncbi:hypothetical protein V6N13_136952 [Hibiscus sabdariffa]|uniref:DC1 domain-containing protein n=1 Tax=Hibiscus sabdariffa TaxID=183260 RepID=A0ABR2DM27_9ROSI